MEDKWKQLPVSAVLSAAIIVACQGCSVKEDRSLCPCSFELDFSQVETSLAQGVEVSIKAADGFLHYDPDAGEGLVEKSKDGVSSMIYAVTVPKSLLSVSAVSGAERLFSPDSGISILLGEECPPIYMHYSHVEAYSARCSEIVRLHKDFCNIGINILSEDGEYPFELTVKGHVNTINPDRSVSNGEFSYSFVPDRRGYGDVRVPRQTDSGLILQIVEEGRTLREFALGEYIAETGYKWTDDDLEDIEVTVDYAHSYITIDVESWAGSFEYEVVI